MQFAKVVIINIDKTSISSSTWKELDKYFLKKVNLPKDSPKILTELKDADCLLVSFGLEVDKKMMDAAPKLKYIGVLATAYGKIDVTYAKKKKIIVSNLAGYSTESVAEFIIAAILENIRGIEEGKRRGRSKNYSEMGIPAFEIKNKTFGIIGLGTIGGRVAELASGFGANVIYNSREKKSNAEKIGLRYVDLDNLVKNSDIISINLAQVKETEGIFSAARFSQLKSGAVVINTAPMELVDLKGLSARLAKKDITFILDHSDEMSEKDLALISKYPNCIIYPPMAYISREATRNKETLFVSNIKNFLLGKPTNIVV